MYTCHYSLPLSSCSFFFLSSLSLSLPLSFVSLSHIQTDEVWYEVASELAHHKLRPSSPDQECLQEIIQCSEERAEEIIRQQHDLIDEQHRQDLDEEYQFYEQLRDAQVSSERAQDKEEKLLLRTSNYKHLKVINNSLVQYKYYAHN